MPPVIAVFVNSKQLRPYPMHVAALISASICGTPQTKISAVGKVHSLIKKLFSSRSIVSHSILQSVLTRRSDVRNNHMMLGVIYSRLRLAGKYRKIAWSRDKWTHRFRELHRKPHHYFVPCFIYFISYFVTCSLFYTLYCVLHDFNHHLLGCFSLTLNDLE